MIKKLALLILVINISLITGGYGMSKLLVFENMEKFNEWNNNCNLVLGLPDVSRGTTNYSCATLNPIDGRVIGIDSYEQFSEGQLEISQEQAELEGFYPESIEE